jgi:hypothetical protein
MNLLSHATRELDALGLTEDSPDEMNVAMRKHILHMVEEFAKEGHSGFSASYTLSLLKKLLAFEPLLPLQGTDDEWNDVSAYGPTDRGPVYQNNRCSHVFKDIDGAYDINGRVFVEPNGSAYTSSESRVRITFPYTPTIEYVQVEAFTE